MDGFLMIGKRGTNVASMDARKSRRPRAPLDERSLGELALTYVGRFSTTRAKLRSYLARKVRERGWSGEREPELAALAERFAAQGYSDDAGFALNQAQGLAARGYGKRRLVEKLRAAGVEEQDGITALSHSDAEAVESALRFAKRRRIGPFASDTTSDRKQREKWIAAMMRAGHGFALVRTIVDLPAGMPIETAELADRAQLDDA
jgi:regulatory protein